MFSRVSLFIITLAVFIITFGFGTSYAATITVNTTDDELNKDGDCSLREAIEAANAIIGDACTRGSFGTDTIVLPAGIYNLTLAGAGEDSNATGDLDIRSDLNITGAGAATTIIDAQGIDRVIHILPTGGGGHTVGISGVTIRGGLSAGAVININEGGGIFNDGGLANGGGELNITDSTINNNSATGTGFNEGGGISTGDGGRLTITNSTVSNNSATGSGANFGGGIFNIGGTVTLANSTVSGNSAVEGEFNWGGGILNFSGALTLDNSTINANTATLGGGVYRFGGTVQFINTIISGTGNCFAVDGTGITTLGINLDSGNTCGFVGANLINTDPLLGPLQDNGGPTFTHALLAGSLAIDTADPAQAQATDQRGYVRPIDGDANGSHLPDIGAFEYGSSIDGDGVPDATEDACANGGDGNGDGTPDKYQADVTSLPAATQNGCLTLWTTCPHRNVQTFLESDIAEEDPQYDYNYGLLSFELLCENTTARVYYHGTTQVDSMYRKYGPLAPVFGPPEWYTMPGVTFAQQTIPAAGGVPTWYAEFALCDGCVGDDTDGTDDVIYDQGGPASALVPALGAFGMVIFITLAGLLALYYLMRRKAGASSRGGRQG